ncbi:hypothetical protein GOP47_0028290 [Adiantum capillus-veneris]|nr:hypothetical protein GOP47_0028290 [Adiantum capillus-veneris]
MQLGEKFQEGDDLARELLQIGWSVMCIIDSEDANNGSLLALINQCSRRPLAYQGQKQRQEESQRPEESAWPRPNARKEGSQGPLHLHAP